MKKILCFIGILLFAAVAYGAETDLAAKIDWSTITDGTILLALSPQSDFYGLHYYNPSNTEWSLFVPSLEELEQFTKFYSFETITLTQNGKTVYILKEINQTEQPVLNGFSLLSPEVLLASLNLKPEQPSCFSLLDGHKNAIIPIAT